MAQSFYPNRTGEHEDRIRRLEEWAARFAGRSPGSATQTQAALKTQAGGSLAGAGASGGGGGSGGQLSGDVTGFPGATTVAALQTVPLVVSFAGQGDLLAYDGTGFTNEQLFTGNYTMRGNNATPTLALAAGSLTDVNPAFTVGDANNDPKTLFWVHPRPDLDLGFHPATVGVTAYQTTLPALLVTASDAGTTNVPVGLSLGHVTSGVVAPGLGMEVDLTAQGPGGGQVVFGWLKALYAGGAAGAENATFIWGSTMAGGIVELMRFRTTLGMAPAGGIGGQVWVRADFLHSGTAFGVFNTTPVAQQVGASAAGIAAITDANAKAAITALQNALHAYGLVTAPA